MPADSLRALIAYERMRLARYGAGLRIVERTGGASTDRTDEIIADLRQSIALNEAALSLFGRRGV